MSAAFDLNEKEAHIDSALSAAHKRKQQRLATLHERLGHLSFARLKLLARAGRISKDLANIDPPTCWRNYLKIIFSIVTK